MAVAGGCRDLIDEPELGTLVRSMNDANLAE